MLFALVLVVVLANVLLITVILDRPPAHPPLPIPNGYDDLVMAAGLVTGDVLNADGLDHNELRVLVATNSTSLRLCRLGLTRRCALPLDSVLAIGLGMAEHVEIMYRMANLLEAEGRLRQMDDHFADALQRYVDSIRFGNEISRGGFVFHRLIGCACEADGGIQLSRLVPKLDSKEARWVKAELEKIENASVPWDEVRRNEYDFQ